MFVMPATGVHSVQTSGRVVGTTFRQSETVGLLKNHPLLRQAPKNATTINSNFAIRNCAMMRTTNMKFLTSFLPAEQRVHNLHFLQNADPDFDEFVWLDALFCRTTLFPTFTRLAIVDFFVIA